MIDSVNRRTLRVLVVEDEYLIALEMEALLEELGCEVIGPAPSVKKALALLDLERPGFAILDVNLGNERSTPVAQALVEMNVPYVVATGYEAKHLPETVLRDAPRLRKPLTIHQLRRVLADPERG
ncbi:response regulator [Tranquillimonas alkanivorans]|uniref:Response regulator receiver domain-containing protein n=1 Tax=Tranquillimonas alkanivorans TaxID=441119 RepID=A0A1I5WQ78_9RHOB|nr:response regulator [Tranquillimonas alkanivorans]SFQ21965.1 Response regulator receiver domain-containing protein [Tranquillimonas alkanivorans]